MLGGAIGGWRGVWAPLLVLAFFSLFARAPRPNSARGMYGHMTMKVGSGLLIYAGSHDVKLGSYAKNLVGHSQAVVRHHRG